MTIVVLSMQILVATAAAAIDGMSAGPMVARRAATVPAGMIRMRRDINSPFRFRHRHGRDRTADGELESGPRDLGGRAPDFARKPTTLLNRLSTVWLHRMF
jgi:hypothetical protein